MSLIDLVTIRELTKDDLNFIINSSAQSLSKYTESIVKGQTKETAYEHMERIILFALVHMGYSVFIACHKDDSDNIIGYIVADTDKNHIFLQYTKYSYRGLGIQKTMLLPLVTDESQPISCNWPTKEMLKLAKVNKITIQNKFLDELLGNIYENQTIDN